MNTSDGLPMAKLRKIVGEDRLEMIRIEKPELYGQLMDYIDGHRAITTRMCKQLLEEYNLNFDVDHDVAFHKQLRAKAEEFGFIVVWPQAAVEPISVQGLNTAWNAGGCCRFKVDNEGFGPSDDVDDVGFLREMVGQVAAAHPVDTSRIYFSGHSNGCT